MRVPGFRFVQAAGNYADRDGLHYGIAIHATSNTASDTAEASYASHRSDGTSAHAYVDWDSLTQALDTDRKAGHAGSAYGNENAIAIEFTGLDSYSRQKWLDSIAWDQVGAWIAYILKNDPDYRGFQVRRATVAEMKANPKVKAFYGHDDMRRAWGGTDHTDPGANFPWDRLFQAVNQALTGGAAALEGDDMALTEWTVGKPAGLRDDQITQGTTETLSSGQAAAGDLSQGHYGMHQRDTVLAGAAEHAAAASRKLDTVIALVSGEPTNHAFDGPLELSDASVERVAAKVADLLAQRLAT